MRSHQERCDEAETERGEDGDEHAEEGAHAAALRGGGDTSADTGAPRALGTINEAKTLAIHEPVSGGVAALDFETIRSSREE